MAETRRFVCIVCPRGCALEVDVDVDVAGEGKAVLALRGNACARGEVYGRSEIVDPRRSLTSTVRVANGKRRRLPVRSTGTIPLPRLREAARALDGIVVEGPLACGTVIAVDFLGLGVDIVATDQLERGM